MVNSLVNSSSSSDLYSIESQKLAFQGEYNPNDSYLLSIRVSEEGTLALGCRISLLPDNLKKMSIECQRALLKENIISNSITYMPESASEERLKYWSGLAGKNRSSGYFEVRELESFLPTKILGMSLKQTAKWKKRHCSSIKMVFEQTINQLKERLQTEIPESSSSSTQTLFHADCLMTSTAFTSSVSKECIISHCIFRNEWVKELQPLINKYHNFLFKHEYLPGFYHSALHYEIESSNLSTETKKKVKEFVFYQLNKMLGQFHVVDLVADSMINSASTKKLEKNESSFSNILICLNVGVNMSIETIDTLHFITDSAKDFEKAKMTNLTYQIKDILRPISELFSIGGKAKDLQEFGMFYQNLFAKQKKQPLAHFYLFDNQSEENNLKKLKQRWVALKDYICLTKTFEHLVHASIEWPEFETEGDLKGAYLGLKTIKNVLSKHSEWLLEQSTGIINEEGLRMRCFQYTVDDLILHSSCLLIGIEDAILQKTINKTFSLSFCAKLQKSIAGFKLQSEEKEVKRKGVGKKLTAFASDLKLREPSSCLLERFRQLQLEMQFFKQKRCIIAEMNLPVFLEKVERGIKAGLDKNNLVDLSIEYQTISERLKNPLTEWAENLMRINQQLKVIQEDFNQIFQTSSLTDIKEELEELKTDCDDFNGEITALVKPFIEFCHDFPRLLTDKKSCLPRRNLEDNLITLLSIPSITIALEPELVEEHVSVEVLEKNEEKNDFSDFSVDIVKTSLNAPSILEAFNSEHVLTDPKVVIEHLFDNAKQSFKLLKNVLNALSRLKIPCSAEVGGNGSHRKLFIGESPIIFANRDELQVGLKNEMLGQVLCALDKLTVSKADQSSSSSSSSSSAPVQKKGRAKKAQAKTKSTKGKLGRNRGR